MNTASPGPADVKVSVAMITYNHERFIAQAIEGVLMQQTDFKVELVIGEDCSTDGTRAIVRRYAERYPEKIRLLLPERNLGGGANSLAVFEACRGQYIALCEGDDYWTAPCKLQTQVAFLDAHPQCAMCFHEAYDLWPDGRKTEYVRSRQTEIKPFYGLEDVVTRHFIPTASIMYHRDLVVPLRSVFLQITARDWMLHVMLAEKGALGFLDQNWSVRRVHPGGVMSMVAPESVAKHVMLNANLIDQYLRGRFAHVLRPVVTGTLVTLCIEVACSASSPALAAVAIEQTIDQYAEVLELTPRERRMVAQEAHFRLVFRMRDRADTLSVRKFWFTTLGVGYRTALLNRGYWSIGLDALIGEVRAAPVHHLLRRLK